MKYPVTSPRQILGHFAAIPRRFWPHSLFPLSVFGSLCLTSRLVKTLLYNFIRQEKCPPPATHIFEPKDEGGLLYGLASGVASTLAHRNSHTDGIHRKKGRRSPTLVNTLISLQAQLQRS